MCLTTTELRTIFADEIAAAGGTISDTFDDGSNLFLRSILPWLREVRPKDKVQGGVALRATEQDVWVHPYVFRQVCRNGAIMAHAIQTEHIEKLHFLTETEATFAVQAAVRGCCVEEAFTVAVEEMRVASMTEADFMLNLMAEISRLPAQVQAQVLRQFVGDGDQSRFGFLNAITAVARDTRDPDLRWQMEELGGGVAAGLRPKPLPDDARARLVAV
jgi:hypothetical protein